MTTAIDTALSSPARLLRSFACDFLTCHDVAAAGRIMHPAYCLTIGGHRFVGRDAQYLPATAAQLEQFPGLCVTVHDVMLGTHAIAMRFTEHGVSRRQGCAAAWGGVTLFRIGAGQLLEGWADEDYFARKRQLSTGVCDAVHPPHVAPWDGQVEPPDASAEAIARQWLKDPGALAAVQAEEISVQGPSFAGLIAVDDFVVDALFSAGSRVAFHAVGRGRYAGGFADVEHSRVGQPVELSVTGLLTVTDGCAARVQIAFDRLGLHRSLRSSTSRVEV